MIHVIRVVIDDEHFPYLQLEVEGQVRHSLYDTAASNFELPVRNVLFGRIRDMIAAHKQQGAPHAQQIQEVRNEESDRRQEKESREEKETGRDGLSDGGKIQSAKGHARVQGRNAALGKQKR